MKKFLVILFALLTLTALTMFTGCPEEDGEENGKKGNESTSEQSGDGSSIDSPIILTASTWADGNIAEATDEQWFKFTAVSDIVTYIHINLGTVNSLHIKLYDGSKNPLTVGEGNFNSSGSANILSSTGKSYYIKITTNSSYVGTYKIMFSSLSSPPATLPSNATELTADTWANGELSTANDKEQWFKFTATAATQYIHIDFYTLTGLYVQVYRSSSSEVGSKTSITKAGVNKYTNRTVTVSDVYYIKISTESSLSGTYKIIFSALTTTPPITLPTEGVTTLTENKFSDGNIPSPGGEQWFKFTATATTQYIHTYPTLSLYVQAYKSDGTTIGNSASFYTGKLYNSWTSLTVGQTYHLRVFTDSAQGNYQIGFTQSTSIPLPVTPISLTIDTWTNGNLPEKGWQWFKFKATAATQYINTNTTQTDFTFQVYDSSGKKVDSDERVYGSTSTPTKNFSRSVNNGEDYYINVTALNFSSGAYNIAFSASNTVMSAPSP
jgi:hypothetical protein